MPTNEWTTTGPASNGPSNATLPRHDSAAKVTTEPVQRGDFTGFSPEFGRVADLTRNFGIKRGTAYNLLRDGKIRGVCLRVRGQKSGVRLWDMTSVRDFIHSQMADAEKAATGTAPAAEAKQ